MQCVRGRILQRLGAVVFGHQFRTMVLAPEFSLDTQWSQRMAEMSQLGLGSDYEWIASVQKKFTSKGIASAIDVDAAVVGATSEDQVEDVKELIYRLRHSANAGDTFESTSYAFIRLLMQTGHDQLISSIIRDPINYGVFPNEHAACLLIDHFLDKDSLNDATQIASYVMLQEMNECELLNNLCAYVCAKWAELPLIEQKLGTDTKTTDDQPDNEQDQLVFKFPYLKNPHFDGHFDLTEPNQLIGKSLAYFGQELKVEYRLTAQLLGCALFGRSRLDRVLHLLNQSNQQQSSTVLPKTIPIIKNLLKSDQPGDAAQFSDDAQFEEKRQLCLDALDRVKLGRSDLELSGAVFEYLDQNKIEMQDSLMNEQRKTFDTWQANRKRFILAQTGKLDCQLRLDKIKAERKAIEDESEVMYFFDNRIEWEKMGGEDASQKKQQIDVNKLTDEEYKQLMFNPQNTN